MKDLGEDVRPSVLGDKAEAYIQAIPDQAHGVVLENGGRNVTVARISLFAKQVILHVARRIKRGRLHPCERKDSQDDAARIAALVLGIRAGILKEGRVANAVLEDQLPHMRVLYFGQSDALERLFRLYRAGGRIERMR